MSGTKRLHLISTISPVGTTHWPTCAGHKSFLALQASTYIKTLVGLMTDLAPRVAFHHKGVPLYAQNQARDQCKVQRICAVTHIFNFAAHIAILIIFHGSQPKQKALPEWSFFTHFNLQLL